jgi:hypothetical protein
MIRIKNEDVSVEFYGNVQPLTFGLLVEEQQAIAKVLKLA